MVVLKVVKKKHGYDLTIMSISKNVSFRRSVINLVPLSFMYELKLFACAGCTQTRGVKSCSDRLLKTILSVMVIAKAFGNLIYQFKQVVR